MLPPTPPTPADGITGQRPEEVAWFLVRCAAIFAILAVHWPGLEALYGACFRACGNAVFNWDNCRAWIHFEPAQGAVSQRFDTVIYLGNRGQMGTDGRLPVRAVELDSRSIGWIPTALMLSLVLATPGSVPIRIKRALASVLLMSGWLHLSLGIWILHEANSAHFLELCHLGRGAALILRRIHETLFIHFGAGLLVPVVIWVLVSHRQMSAPPTRNSSLPGRT